MRCDTTFEGKPVLAIVLSDQHIAGHLSHPIRDITRAVTLGYGEKNVPRDFLIDEGGTGFIKRKRKCVVIYLSKLHPNIVENVKEGEFRI